jgi:hypothetical protein
VRRSDGIDLHGEAAVVAESSSKRIKIHVAINERGDYCLSESGPQEALTALIDSRGGDAFRVLDIEFEIPLASIDETRERRASASELRLVK